MGASSSSGGQQGEARAPLVDRGSVAATVTITYPNKKDTFGRIATDGLVGTLPRCWRCCDSFAGLAMRITFHGAGGATHDVDFLPATLWGTGLSRVTKTQGPRAALESPAFLTMMYIDRAGNLTHDISQTMSGSDFYLNGVTIKVEDGSDPTEIEFPYRGWGSSPDALIVFPGVTKVHEKMSVVEQEAAAAQIILNQAQYRFAQWAYIKVPHNIASRDFLMSIYSWLGAVNSNVEKYNMNAKADQAPGLRIASQKQTSLAVARAKEVVKEMGVEGALHGAKDLFLPVNEVMGSPCALQKDIYRVATGAMAHGCTGACMTLGGCMTCECCKSSKPEEIEPEPRRSYEYMKKEPDIPGMYEALAKLDIEAQKGHRPSTEDTLEELNYRSPLEVGGLLSRLPEPGQYNKPKGLKNVRKTREIWNEDWFLGQQMLQGVAPNLIELVRGKLPSKLAVTDHLLGDLLGGMKLSEAIKAKRLFIVDMAILDGVACFEGGKLFSANFTTGQKFIDAYLTDHSQRFCCAAIGLFFLKVGGSCSGTKPLPKDPLLPVAIQLGQDGKKDPVYTALDSRPEWTVAKMFLQCAIGNAHQVDTHALRTHLCAEPWHVAVKRHLPSIHPIYKLTSTFVRYTLQINMEARADLIAPGGIFDAFIASGATASQWATSPLTKGGEGSYKGVGYVHLFEKAFAGYTTTQNHLPNQIAARGVTKDELPCDYPYRDDGLLVWDALHGLVDGILRVHYADDAAVKRDVHLQGLAQELHLAFSDRLPGEGKGFPEDSLSTLQKLVDTVAGVFWGAGFQHSAVNYLQYDHMGWIPNLPLAIHKPVPKRGEGPKTMKDVLDYLPPVHNATKQIAVVNLLSSYYGSQMYMSHVDRAFGRMFNGDGERAALEKYKKAIEKIEETVRGRNETRAVYYHCYIPSKCPISITI